LLVHNPWSNDIEPHEPKREAFASDGISKASETPPFDGKRAIGYLEELRKIGSRISGTDATFLRLADQIRDGLQEGVVVKAAFCQIVIRADLKTSQAVFFTFFIRDDDHRNGF